MANLIDTRKKDAEKQRRYRKTEGYKLWRKEHQRRNREKINTQARQWCATNPRTVAAYREKYKNDHGEKRKLLGRAANRRRQGLPEPTRPEPPECEICGRPPRRCSLHLDHCHETGMFRGWLCYACNSALGKLGDNLLSVLRAVEYLRRAKSVT